MKLTKTEAEELACLVEFYLEDEKDKEQRAFWKSILGKLRNG